MKVRNLFLFSAALLFFVSCKKDGPGTKQAQVKVQIDYLGDGGFYNDNIDGVPTGLIIGTNGPFPASTEKSYTLTYKADANFPPTSINNWTPTSGSVWIIHCYVVGNIEHIETYPE